MSEAGETAVTRCFVIGPIGNKFAPIGDPAREIYEQALEVFENVIQPACQSLSLEPVRADQIALTGEITEQVFRHIYNDEVVIADVSGGNPNVMYELGLRHTRPLLTVQIGEFGQLPFDVSAVRTIQFSRSPRGLIDARKALVAALEIGMAEPGDGVTATRIWNSGTPNYGPEGEPSAISTTAESVTEEFDDESGFLDHIADVEKTLPHLSDISAKIGATVAEMGEIATESSGAMSLANATGLPASQRLGIVGKFATKLQGPADELFALTTTFLADMRDLDYQLRGIFRYLEESPDTGQTSDIGQFLDSIVEMARSSREAMENINQFDGAMKTLSGMSKLLRRPAGKVSDSIRLMLEGIELTDAWEGAVLRLKRLRSADGH